MATEGAERIGKRKVWVKVTFVDGQGRRWMRRDREVWRRGEDGHVQRGIIANGQWTPLPENNEINISAIGSKLPLRARPVND